MLTKMMKFVSIAALILAALLWKYASSHQLPLRFVVSLGAFLVALQAVRAAKYVWATGFFAITAVFNPFVTVGTFTGNLAFCLVLASVAPFVVSLFALRTQPLLSIPSITDRTPGSQSL
jgi:hypothetical protein